MDKPAPHPLHVAEFCGHVVISSFFEKISPRTPAAERRRGGAPVPAARDSLDTLTKPNPGAPTASAERANAVFAHEIRRGGGYSLPPPNICLDVRWIRLGAHFRFAGRAKSWKAPVPAPPPPAALGDEPRLHTEAANDLDQRGVGGACVVGMAELSVPGDEWNAICVLVAASDGRAGSGLWFAACPRRESTGGAVLDHHAALIVGRGRGTGSPCKACSANTCRSSSSSRSPP